MPTISACVIAKNEEAHIARCLQSVKDIANEIILVDTGSSDNTVELAQIFGAKIFYFKWNNDFSAARNFALDHANGNWIIFLDADEYIDPNHTTNVHLLLNKIHGNRKISAVSCIMKHYAELGGRDMGTTQTVRIFRNSTKIRYAGRIHERLDKHGSVLRDAHVPESMLCIHHTGYTDSSLNEKSRRNLTLLENELADGLADHLTYYYLSQSYINLDEYEKSIDFARQSLADGKIDSTFVAYKPYVYMIKSMLNLNTYGVEQLQPIIAEAQQKYPRHPEISALIAVYHYKLGHYNQALDYALSALQFNQNFTDRLDNEFDKDAVYAHNLIAGIYDRMNDAVKSFDHAFLALKHKKYHDASFDRLICCVRRQSPADIVHLLEQQYSSNDKDDALYVLRRLIRFNLKLVLAHYIKKVSPYIQPDSLIGIKFFLADKYEQAFMFYASVFHISGKQNDEFMAFLAIILGNKKEWLDYLFPNQNTPLQRLGAAYFSSDDAPKCPAEDFPAYIILVLYVCQILDKTKLDKLLDLYSHYPVANAAVQIANALFDQNLFPAALSFCLKALKQPALPPDQSGDLWYKAACCCFRLKKYEDAVLFFTHALEQSPPPIGIADYLTWTHSQCDNFSIKQQIESLKSRYLDDAREQHSFAKKAPPSSMLPPSNSNCWIELNESVQTKVKEPLRIETLSCVYNEEYLLPYYLKHYDWCDKFNILYSDSTDKSLDILKQHPKVNLITATFPDGIDDRLKINLINSTYMMLNCDVVINVDIDEFIHNGKQDFERYSIFPIINAKFFDVYRHITDKDLDINIPVKEQRKHGHFHNMYNKPIIVHTGLNISWAEGNHRINNIRGENCGFIGSHWSNADPCFCIDRRVRNRAQRQSKVNIQNQFGVQHHNITVQDVINQCTVHENDPQLWE